MSAAKCSQCGLPKHPSAERCKRCQASLLAPTAPAESISGSAETEARLASLGVKKFVRFDDKSFLSPLRVLIVVLLFGCAVWYLIDRDGKQRAAQLKADKEIALKRQADDLKSRPVPVIKQWPLPPFHRPSPDYFPPH